MKLFFYAFTFFLCLVCSFWSYCVGTWVARREIADAIRDGRLNLEQRLESVAAQVESGFYRRADP